MAFFHFQEIKEICLKILPHPQNKRKQRNTRTTQLKEQQKMSSSNQLKGVYRITASESGETYTIDFQPQGRRKMSGTITGTNVIVSVFIQPKERPDGLRMEIGATILFGQWIDDAHRLLEMTSGGQQTYVGEWERLADTDPVRTLHHNIASKSSDAMMTETEKKINDKGERVEAFLMSQDQGLQLVCFPSPSSIVLEKKDTEQFITHTCLWGHYKLRSLNSSLYGEKPKMVDEEEESDEEVSVMTSFPSMLSPAGALDNIDDAVSGEEEGEEGDTFAENTLLSPSGASVSTPSSTTPTTNKSKSKRRPSLRTTNSFRQKGRNKTFTRQNAKNKESNKQKKKQTGQSKKIRTRRTSMFAAVGTNDLSYLGVSANRFAEIQSSIWSTMLPTMGKVSSTINKRGRRMSMIGGGGLKKSPRKKKESVLQKMMKQHAEDATKETKVIQTPRNKKNLRRGNSVGIMRTPLRSDVGGSGGQKGRFGRTPGKSTVKKGGSRLGHHKSESLDMNQPNWNESVVSPSMNTLISKRLHNLSLDNVRSIGKQRIDLKKRLVALEKEMKKASVTAMVRWHQLKKAKNGTEGNGTEGSMKPRQLSATPGTAMQEEEEEEEGSMYQRQLSGTAMHEEEEEEEEEVTEYSEYDGF